MKIRVLGCYGGELPGHRTSSFLLNDTIALDAGAVTSSLSFEEQKRIRAILISHAHLDHIKDIGFLADNLFGMIASPIRLVSIAEVLDTLRAHYFNGKIWPDFTRLPSRRRSLYAPLPLTPLKQRKIEGLVVTAVPVNHSVDGVGYIISDGKGSIVYSGDTGPTDLIWKEANKLDNLRAVLLETSFPNKMMEFSTRVGHLSPRTLLEEVEKIEDRTVPVYVYHLKPQFDGILRREIGALDCPRVKILSQGDILSL